MALRDLIQSLKLTGTATEIADTLNAKTVTVHQTDMRTWATLADRFGADAVAKFDGVLKAAGLEWVRTTLAGAGLDFSNDKTQDIIDQFAAAEMITSGEAAALKSLGIRRASPYEQWAGDGSVVTEAEVIAALDVPVADGRSVSVAVSITPSRNSLALSVQSMAGDQSLGVVHSIAVSRADDPALTDAQRVFVAALWSLVANYEVPQ